MACMWPPCSHCAGGLTSVNAQVYSLCDDLMLLCDGHIVYYGPVEGAMPFFNAQVPPLATPGSTGWGAESDRGLQPARLGRFCCAWGPGRLAAWWLHGSQLKPVRAGSRPASRLRCNGSGRQADEWGHAKGAQHAHRGRC